MATIGVLNERYSTDILLHVYRHEGCMKTDSRTRLPEKIQGPDNAGPLGQDVDRITRIYTTDPGKRVASKLSGIETILERVD